MRSRGRSTEWIDGHKDGTDGRTDCGAISCPKTTSNQVNLTATSSAPKNEREGKKKTARAACGIGEAEDAPAPTNDRETNGSLQDASSLAQSRMH